MLCEIDASEGHEFGMNRAPNIRKGSRAALRTGYQACGRLPRQALLDNTMAALPLGIARTAIDTLVEIAAGGKRPAGAGAPLAERTTVQADVARAEALYLSGRSFLYDAVTQSWEAVKAGRELSGDCQEFRARRAVETAIRPWPL